MTKRDTKISWELPFGFEGFAEEARAFLADRYKGQGETASADCIRLGMPVDHDSHIALLILTEFIRARPTTERTPTA